VDLDHDGATILVTRLKPDANAAKLHIGDRVRLGVVNYSVLAESSAALPQGLTSGLQTVSTGSDSDLVNDGSQKSLWKIAR
jgi:hypothetical protein